MGGQALKVEFCASNMDLDGSRPVYERLRRAYPDLDVREYGCLGNCERCVEGPYCLVDGRFIQAATADELWQKLLDLIQPAPTHR